MNDSRFDEILLRSMMESKDLIPGGLSDGDPDSEFNPEQLEMGTKAELEHTSSREMAKEIAKDHLKEDSKYYTKLKKMEAEEVSKEKPPISEKQTAAQRHTKHKEWRKKNPQKVRDQVARHQTKTDQNKNREDTRGRKERGEISKSPSCANCGGKTNVQHDHQNGYAKGSGTKALCHKCHTNRPQQNKSGEKSVKGGTVKVAKESKRKPMDPLMRIIFDNTPRDLYS